MSWRPRITWKGVGRVVFAYAAICVFMWAAQRHLLYVPNTSIQSPENYGLADFSEQALTTSDNELVQVWYHKAQDGYPTVVHFHGNAGNLSHRAHFFKTLSVLGYGVLGLDYRGFGKSSGSPTEQGFYNDARATLKYATQALAIPQSRLILYGESIGTGVAVQMATECDCAALVLQSPYTSIEKVAQDTYPWLPVSLLLVDRFDSLAKAAAVKEPALLMHGEQDTVIDISQGKELFAHLSEPKQALYFPGKNHNDLDIAALVKALDAFSHAQKLTPPVAN